MAVSNQIPRNVSTASSGATVFPYGFKVLSKSDLLVQVNGEDRQVDVHYTIDGIGMDAGGNITFLTPMIGGEVVLRRRNMPLERQTDFQQLGDLRSATLNNDQDAPVLMIQQVAANLQQFLDTDPTPLAVASAEAAAVSEWNANQSRIAASAAAGAAAGSAASAANSAAAAAFVVQDLQDEVEAIADGQGAGQLVYRTWAELSAVTGSAGSGAQVINDAGTHTDPVVGGTVSNAGQYVWSASPAGWRWVRDDGLALKASRAEVAEIAGTLSPTIRDSLIEIDRDPGGNVAYAVHADGTREFIRQKVGGLTVTRYGPDSAKVDGRAEWHGSYTQWAQPLGGGFANALEIDIDSFGRVGRILWSDGSVWPEGGGGAKSFVLREQITLPDGAQGQNANGGFTCTGLDKITTGKWIGCWLVGNDGRAFEGSTLFQCSIVILSPDMRRILVEIPCNTADFPGIQSIQGVAWDTSDNTIWFVDKTNSTIRHINLSGVKLTDEIVVSHALNGIAYRADQDALYSANEGGSQLYLLSCVNGAVLSTVTGISAQADQLFYYAAANEVWATTGNNGVDGMVRMYSATTGTMLRFQTLPGSQAIEGLYFDGYELTTVNDGAFHVGANPPLALACKYHYT